LLEADQLTRIVGRDVLLEEVTFTVRAEEVFVVFGPSGAGKSTLLRLLNRLDEPTRGTVYLDGADYRTLPPREVRRRIGLVQQQPTLTDGTVADNVAWGPVLRGEAVDRERLKTLLERLGLAGFADRSADELSGGEAQRVAIARTLLNDPDVLLLDEPASSLDAASAQRVETVLQEVMAALSVTTILVTHDAERARRLGSRGLRLDRGRVVETGPIGRVVEASPTPPER